MEPVFEEYMNLSRRERSQRCKVAVENIVNFCYSQDLTDRETVNFLANLTKLFVSVDRVCEQAEYELFIDVTGFDLTMDDFFEITNGGAAQDFVDYVLELIKLMPEDRKSDVALFGLCMCSADREITEAERMMIFRTLD